MTATTDTLLTVTVATLGGGTTLGTATANTGYGDVLVYFYFATLPSLVSGST